MPRATAWNRVFVVLFAAVAGAFGSGVGDLVGGVAGATLQGSLVAMALVFATAPQVSAVTGARAAAVAAVAGAMGFVGTDMPALVIPAGHGGGDLWTEIARRCGASAARGAVQIALLSTFLGMTLNGRSVTRSGPMLIGAASVGAWWWGERILGALPPSIQSGLTGVVFPSPLEADQRFQVVAWCAASLVLLALLIWVRLVKDDRLAFRLGLWGAVAGGLACGLVESLSFAAMWPPAMAITTALKVWLERVPTESLQAVAQGFVWGGVLGWAAHRERAAFASTPDTGSLRAPWEFGLVAMHAIILLAAQFAKQTSVGGLLEAYSGSGLVAAVLPLICILTGRRVPWIVLLPVALAPLIGKALQHAAYDAKSLQVDVGWLALVAVPVGAACATAAWAIIRDQEEPAGGAVVPIGLAMVVSVATAAGLSTALLDFSWPWKDLTPHTGMLTVLGSLAAILMVSAIRAMSMAGSGSTSGLPSGTTPT